MGKGGGSSGQTTQTSGPPPQVLANYQNIYNRALGVANAPLQQYDPTKMLAPLNQNQNQAISQVQGLQGAAQPYINSAQKYAAAGAQPIWGQLPTYSASSLAQYQNPYTSQVVDATKAQMDQQNDIQQQGLAGKAIGAGAFGSDRAGIAQDVLAGQQNMAENSTLANLRNQGFTEATGEFNNQQQNQLNAMQGDAWRNSNTAYEMGNLGQEALNTGLTGTQALWGMGQNQQNQAQAQLNIPYEQFMQQQAYPFQTTNFLAGIGEGTGSLSGTNSTTTQPSPSTGSQILGGLAGGAGLIGQTGGYGSNGWLSNWLGGSGGSMGSFGLDSGALDASGALQSTVDPNLFQSALSTIGDIPVKRGGVVHRDSGGGVGAGAPVSDGVMSGPGTDMNTNPWGVSGLAPTRGGAMSPFSAQTKTSGGGGGGGDALSTIGNIAKVASFAVALKRGGVVPHMAGGGNAPLGIQEQMNPIAKQQADNYNALDINTLMGLEVQARNSPSGATALPYIQQAIQRKQMGQSPPQGTTQVANANINPNGQLSTSAPAQGIAAPQAPGQPTMAAASGGLVPTNAAAAMHEIAAAAQPHLARVKHMAYGGMAPASPPMYPPIGGGPKPLYTPIGMGPSPGMPGSGSPMMSQPEQPQQPGPGQPPMAPGEPPFGPSTMSRGGLAGYSYGGYARHYAPGGPIDDVPVDSPPSASDSTDALDASSDPEVLAAKRGLVPSVQSSPLPPVTPATGTPAVADVKVTPDVRSAAATTAATMGQAVVDTVAQRGLLPQHHDDSFNWSMSPWAALTNAGAAMMTKPGNFGQSIGYGLQAANQTLGKQHDQTVKEDQEAQQNNFKATELGDTKAYRDQTVQEDADRLHADIKNHADQLKIDQDRLALTEKQDKATNADRDRDYGLREKEFNLNSAGTYGSEYVEPDANSPTGFSRKAFNPRTKDTTTLGPAQDPTRAQAQKTPEELDRAIQAEVEAKIANDQKLLKNNSMTQDQLDAARAKYTSDAYARMGKTPPGQGDASGTPKPVPRPPNMDDSSLINAAKQQYDSVQSPVAKQQILLRLKAMGVKYDPKVFGVTP
jgi:hypothetical protein